MTLNPFRLSELVDVDNLEDAFALRLERMLIDPRLGGRVRISSAYRTTAQQESLWLAYLERNRRPPKVAKPGTSNHERGLAADLDLAWRAPFGWPLVHDIAAEYGLAFPVDGEPWHVEPKRGAPPLIDPEDVDNMTPDQVQQLAGAIVERAMTYPITTRYDVGTKDEREVTIELRQLIGNAYIEQQRDA